MNQAFEDANKTIHPVESQWHYPIMTKHGYKAITKTGVGFVRSYMYVHPVSGKTFKLTTGSSADYWSEVLPEGSTETAGWGYWSKLEPYLEKVSVDLCTN